MNKHEVAYIDACGDRTLETLIGDDYVAIDVGAAWEDEFSRWDALVDTATAERIANAVTAVLRDEYERRLDMRL